MAVALKRLTPEGLFKPAAYTPRHDIRRRRAAG